MLSKVCDVGHVRACDIDRVTSAAYSMYKPDCVLYAQNDENIACAHTCKELIEIRDGIRDSQLTATECSQLIEYLCTI